MAQGGCVTQVSLNAQLIDLSKDIVKIDLKIQDLKQKGNQQQLIRVLEITKEDKQRDIVNLQIQLQQLKARNRNMRC